MSKPIFALPLGAPTQTTVELLDGEVNRVINDLYPLNVEGAEEVVATINSAYQGRQYTTRALFEADTGYAPQDGTVVTAGGVSYARQAGATAIADLAGWLPYDTITPRHFGADGAGIIDNTAAVQATMDYADSLYQFCDLEDGYLYRCSEKIRLARRVKGRSTLDYSGVASGFGRCTEITGEKTATDSALTENAPLASFSVSVADGSLFAVGDRVLIQSEALYLGLAGVNVRKGEIMRVQSVTDNTIRFDTPIHEPYLTADTAKLVKLNMVTGVDHRFFKVLGPAIEGGGIQGICYDWCEDIRVDDTRSSDCDIYAMPFQSCTHVRISGTRTDTVRFTGSGTIFYGIVLLNACKDVRIEGAYAKEVRHHITTTSAQTQYGEPLYVKAVNCHAEDMMAGTTFASYGYENHGYGRFVDFVSCSVDGAFGLGKCEGSDTRYINCTGRNLSVTGVRIPSTPLDVRNVLVTGCTFSSATAGKASGSTVALDMPLQPAGRKRENIVFKHNLVEGWATTEGLADYGADIRGSAADSKDICLTGNTFIADPAQRASDYAIFIRCPGMTVEGNKILGDWPRGVFYDTDDIKSRRNIFRRDTPGPEIAMRVLGDNFDSLDDEFENYGTAALPVGTPANTRLRGGTFKNVTTRINDPATFCNNGLSLSGEFADTFNLQIIGGVFTGPKAADRGNVTVFVDTELLADSDDLDTIPAEPRGNRKNLQIVSSARVVTVKHATGNIRLAGGADFAMTGARSTIQLVSTGGIWIEAWRSVV